MRLRTIGGALAVVVLAGSAVFGQTTAKKTYTAFDVASVRENKSDGAPDTNFPLGPGDVYVPNSGLFHAVNMPLMVYISFAYKVQSNQGPALANQLPDWVKASRYDIEAKVEGNPAKDDMRMMMRDLLQQRFGLKIHTEMRETSVLDLVLAKPGVTGKTLRAHPANDPSCPKDVDPGVMRGNADLPKNTADGFPGVCGGILGMPAGEGRIKMGARDIPMLLFANFITGVGNLGKPVIDKTGLTGKFDFTLEFAPDAALFGPGSNFTPDQTAPSVLNALTEQLGLKLVSSKGQVETLVVDHIDHLIEN